MHVSAIRLYPVKSAGGVDVREAAVQPWGLEHDRRWMVVDSGGTTVTARTHRRLLHVTATPLSGGGVTLAAPGRDQLTVRPQRDGDGDGECDGDVVRLTLSRIETASAPAPDADAWLSDHLGEDVRLVWLDDPRRRTVSEAHGGEPGDSLSFADAGPILLTTTRSLAQLDEWTALTAERLGEARPEPLPMERFRPNLVVDGVEEPFAEDDWKRLSVGDVELRLGEHCDRCVLPTIDPVSLAGGKEPTRTLALHRQWDHEVHFGVRMIPVSLGRIRVGDPVADVG